VPVSLLAQKTWLTQIPHRYLTGHNGLYLASSIITLMFFSLSRLNTVQNNKDTKKRKCTHTHTHTHTHSLSLSLSLSPSLEDQQEVQTKLLPANCNPIIISPCFLRKLVLCYYVPLFMFLVKTCAYQCWTGIDVWTYQSGPYIGYLFKNPYESLVLVFGPF
jgi:hypothetical protein